MRVIFISDNYMGGVNSLNKNLMRYNPDPSNFEQWVIQVDCRESEHARAAVGYKADKTIPFHYSRKDNYYHVLRRLRKQIPDEPGALVLNDFLEMWMLDKYPVKQTVYQLIHDTYYVRLAEQHHNVVDVFITHNLSLFGMLQEKLPHRKDDIFYLPHGVVIPPFHRDPGQHKEGNPLKLLFLARMVESKGIFDLVTISEMLRNAGCQFEWICMGRGPDLGKLKERWDPRVPVQFLSPDSNEEVIEIAARQDVFVLPTKFDGTPVSLLETMSVGLTPVITDLPGGIHEIVKEDIGFALRMDDNQAFASAIERLYRDSHLLDRLSVNAREKAARQFDVRDTTRAYFDKFSAYETFYKRKTLSRRKYGSRLDSPLVPPFVTRTLRSFRN